jgi:hypothetical protein
VNADGCAGLAGSVTTATTSGAASTGRATTATGTAGIAGGTGRHRRTNHALRHGFLKFGNSHGLIFGNLFNADRWRSRGAICLRTLIDARQFLTAAAHKLDFRCAGKANIFTERKMDFPGIIAGRIGASRLAARLLRVLSVLCTISCRWGEIFSQITHDT